ncbi:hypothetical protein [Halorhodospira sp. 9622]|uniref:hypothetical protein n=1 Tax=Halorhodospira sp. 9622 TaxID=2899136 RepID=UPI001EE9070B|nr:hypothetical protein [Halorhodospira sp. 9622]MCG5538966.1 hypothetical protein [Halorhodospira sp. 9622]
MRTLYEGKKSDIRATDAAWKAWQQARAQVPGNQSQCEAQLIARLQTLADRDHLPIPKALSREGDGIQAVKAHCGLRAYGWFTSDSKGKKLFIIAHAVMKKQDKALKQDLDRVKAERQKIEGK